MGLERLPVEEYRWCHLFNVVIMVKSKPLRLPTYVARMGEGRTALKILKGKSIGRKALGRPNHQWKDNIREALKEM